MKMSRTVCGLMAVAAGAGIVAVMLPAARNRRVLQQNQPDSQRIDETIEDSFPASDPPSFSGTASQPSGIPHA
jgi:hypothetical protein